MTQEATTPHETLPQLVPLAELDSSDLDPRACRALWSSVFYQSLRQHFEAGQTPDGRPYDSWVASRDFRDIAELLGLDAEQLRAWVKAEWQKPHPGRSLGGWGNPRTRDNPGRTK